MTVLFHLEAETEFNEAITGLDVMMPLPISWRFCLNLVRLDGKKNSMRGKLKQVGWSNISRAEMLFRAGA